MVEKKQYTSDELAEWLIEKASESAPSVARKLIMSNDPRGRDMTMIGKLYFFKYDPKGKGYLPQYDKFPMCFPIKRYGGGFLGLNLHYLSGGQRSAFINLLLEYKNNRYMDETTRLLLSYDKLVASSDTESMTKQCVKRYLFTNCRSRFIEIYPNEYDKAIALPVEEWVYKQ